MNSKALRALLLAAAGLALGGCSDIFPYTSDGTPDNVTFTPQLSSGAVRMDVYDVDAACKETYAGSVQPGSHPVKLGMPVNQERYLAFVFQDASFFTGAHSSSTGQYFKPAPGAAYEIKASYGDSMYNVEIREHGRGGWHDMPKAIPRACMQARK